MQIKNDLAIRAHARRLVWGVTLAGAGVLLSACSGGGDGGVSAPVASAKSLSGRALGGQQPVVGATVTLYAASNGGYGASNTPLGTTTTVAGGNWSFSGLSCPSANVNVPLYVVATGGSAVGGSTNSAIGLSSALGPCSTAITGTGYNIDEITTVASAFALAQFLDNSGQHLGTSASNATGLANAVANVAMLADLDAGTAQTVLPSGASGTLPAATLNTLGNLLAACVNTTSNTSTQCSGLISAATPAGGSAPSTTLQAALNIALNPGNNVAALYKLATYSNAPFQTPAPLGAQPNDWTLAVNFNGGSLDSSSLPEGLAVDALGDVWVTSFTTNGNINGGNGMVLELSPQGQQLGPYSDNGNIANPIGIAIDGGGNVWVANNGGGSVSGLNSVGNPLLNSPFTGKMNRPKAIAIDQSGNVWEADGVNTRNNTYVSMLSASNSYAVTSYATPAEGTSKQKYSGIVVDASGNLWLADGGGSPFLMHLSAANPTQNLSGSPYTVGPTGTTQVAGLAIDGQGNIWSPDSPSNGSSGNGVTKLVAVSSFSDSQFTNNDILSPAAIAVDGAGKAWIFNSDSTSAYGLVVVANDGTPLTGSGQWTGGGVLNGAVPSAIAVDASGNVWVAGGNALNVVEFIGSATPVKTPLVGPAKLP